MCNSSINRCKFDVLWLSSEADREKKVSASWNNNTRYSDCILSNHSAGWRIGHLRPNRVAPSFSFFIVVFLATLSYVIYLTCLADAYKYKTVGLSLNIRKRNAIWTWWPSVESIKITFVGRWHVLFSMASRSFFFISWRVKREKKRNISSQQSQWKNNTNKVNGILIGQNLKTIFTL